VLLLYAVAASALGLAAAPALALVARAWQWTQPLPAAAAWPLRGLAAASAWFVSGLTLLVLVPCYNRVLPTRIRPYKGGYYSLATVPWFLHNGLFYIVRFTFLPFATLTPFGIWFLKGMGMRIGRAAFINTEYLSDPALITIGDEAVVGGSVRLFAHYGGGGRLVIAPVVVGARSTLGVACTIMGDVIIGEGALILPHSVVLPGSRVGAGETWGGVPARPMEAGDFENLKLRTRCDPEDRPPGPPVPPSGPGPAPPLPG